MNFETTSYEPRNTVHMKWVQNCVFGPKAADVCQNLPTSLKRRGSYEGGSYEPSKRFIIPRPLCLRNGRLQVQGGHILATTSESTALNVHFGRFALYVSNIVNSASPMQRSS